MKTSPGPTGAAVLSLRLTQAKEEITVVNVRKLFKVAFVCLTSCLQPIQKPHAERDFYCLDTKARMFWDGRERDGVFTSDHFLALHGSRAGPLGGTSYRASGSEAKPGIWDGFLARLA
jgi:hypothetical protein